MDAIFGDDWGSNTFCQRCGGCGHSNIVMRALLECRTQTPLICVTNLPRSGGTLFITPDGRTVDHTQRSKILVENSNFLVSHLHFTPLLGGLH